VCQTERRQSIEAGPDKAVCALPAVPIRETPAFYLCHRQCDLDGDIHFSARDMAKFGLLYLNDGKWEGD
jgi:hypothetical protein